MDFYGYINIVQLDFLKGSSTEYPFNIPTLKYFKKIVFHPKVTHLIGENGMGKSTLLEAIAVNSGFNAEGLVRLVPKLMMSLKLYTPT